PLEEWVKLKKPQTYLDELVQLDGRNEYIDYAMCLACQKVPGIYRCKDCFTDDLYCKACLVTKHVDSPFHRVEVSSLRIRYETRRRGHCVLPKTAVDDDFVIIDTHGIHEVNLDFCNCSTAQPHDIQLLRARLYPATGKSPRSASSFRVLRRFHLMTLESKCSAQEFYNSLKRESDNSGTVPVRVSNFAVSEKGKN
ncbi:hypothetical protein C8R43DRAFT_883129, partial [Mycena crocata]